MTFVAIAVRVWQRRFWRRLLRQAEGLSSALPLLRSAGTADVLLAVGRAGRVVPHGSNCLVRALTARTLMAPAAQAPQIVVGVRKTADGGLQAHAWLYCNGALVMGGGAPEAYEPLPDLGHRL